MMRHDDTEADLGIATEGLAEMRLAALLHTGAMAAPAPPTSISERVQAMPGGSNWTQLGPMAIPNGQTYTAMQCWFQGV